MRKGSYKHTLLLGSLTASVALLSLIPNGRAQSADSGTPAPASAAGAGSFPLSFLVPGTNTSLAVYGVIRMEIKDNLGSMHTSAIGAPFGPLSVPFQIGALALQGPGAAGANSVASGENAIHGGLQLVSSISSVTFETRTPTNLGEVKTVLFMDTSLFPNSANYSSSATTQNINPRAGQGNANAARLLWAYGTLGPWLVGQYNSAYADAQLFPDVADAGFDPGFVSTANIRQPQIRYTYLAGHGLTLSASVEYQESGTLYLTPAGAMTSAAVAQVTSDNTDIGGVVNLPSFNTGVAWDQPWGHLMTRVGVNRNEVRNTLLGVNILSPLAPGNGSNNIKKWGYAVEAGGYLNTWGQDQWKFLVNYAKGVPNYQTELSPSNAGGMFCNGYLGRCNLISMLGVATSYTRRFSPNWRSTASWGMGFFSKPSATSGLTNVGTGATAAQLASFEKTHLSSHLNVVYSPVPGLVEIYVEWDHYNRWVQASNTSGTMNNYHVDFAFFW